jgi:hypothetical protein
VGIEVEQAMSKDPNLHPNGAIMQEPLDYQSQNSAEHVGSISALGIKY